MTPSRATVPNPAFIPNRADHTEICWEVPAATDTFKMHMDTTTDVEPTKPTELNAEAVMKLPIRPGYMEQVLNDKTYVVPKVLGQQLGAGLSLGRIEKPDLSKALEMSGGVRFFLFVAIHSIDFCISNPSSQPDSGSDHYIVQSA